jgi:hypothetical protein
MVLLCSPVRTLASLTKVDDYPLYVMRYHGGYLFDHYMKGGIDRGVFKLVYERLYQMNYPEGCTSFSALTPQGDAILGRNFDWRHRASLLLFTDPPGGYASVSMVDIHYFGFGEEQVPWTRRLYLLAAPYATVDGMNEHGLAVSEMAVPCRDAPYDPDRATILNSHISRLVLDRAKSVDEALDLVGDVNVYFPVACTHHLIADASGDSAVVEYTGGAVVVTRSTEPWQVSTNFLLSEEPTEGAPPPCWRYSAADKALRKTDGIVTAVGAMDIARRTSKHDTVWSIIYDLSKGGIHLAMGRNYDRVHRFELDMNPE